MKNLYLIRKENNSPQEKYVSPMRGNGDGTFLWDAKLHAYIFTDETITDRELTKFLSGEKYRLIKVDTDCANRYRRHEKYVPTVEMKDRSKIIHEMSTSLNTMQRKADRLIDTMYDSAVTDAEVADFIAIQDELEKISVVIKKMKVWTKKMLSTSSVSLDIDNETKRK